MEIILIENVKKLGNIGQVIKVKDGFARNFLIPYGKAIRATEMNKKFYDEQKAAIIAEDKSKRDKAQQLVSKLPKSITLIRQAAEDGRLFGSVNSRDIANGVNEGSNLSLTRSNIVSEQAIKYLGLYKIEVSLHPEVTATVLVNVARTEDEAAQALASYQDQEVAS